MSVTATNKVLTGDNPFGIDIDHYKIMGVPPQGDAAWSETHYWAIWNPEQNIGVYVHMGVDEVDKYLWWAQVFAYLPNGIIVADRSWGRSEDRLGPRTGNFSAICTEPLKRWKLKFDGAGEVVSSDEMGRRLVGAGPAVPMSFEVDMVATMPIWDLYKAVDIGTHKLGGVHHEQVLVSTGTLTIGAAEYGGTWRLDGTVSRDHSRGSRDLSQLGGDHLFGFYFPESKRSVQALIMWDAQGKVAIRAASIGRGDELELTSDVETTGTEKDRAKPNGLMDSLGNPKTFTMTLGLNEGRMVLQGEVLHTLQCSLIGSNTNVNGTAYSIPGDHLVTVECPVRMIWPDGEVGYGQMGRTYRFSLLPGWQK